MTSRPKRSQQKNTDARWLQAVIETVVDGVILTDARGRLLMFNPACEKLFQYRAEEVIGKNVGMLMPALFDAERGGHLGNFARTDERKIVDIGREVFGQRKDGSTFPMDLSVGEAEDEDGPIFVGIIHDLTERERLDRALQESAARIRAVIETAVDGVLLIDARGGILMFNPACEKLFGYHVDEIIHENVKLLMPSSFPVEQDGHIGNFLETGDRKIIGAGREVIGQRKDGTTFPMDFSVGEAKQDGQAIFVGIVHDLTDRKHTEELLVQAQKMEMVGQLSGGIAHDFNNLLTVIVGNAEFLSAQLKSRQDLRQLADDIGRAGERGGELTQRLLAFSRRQTLRPVEIDCNELLDSMYKLLRRTMREDIEIKIDLDVKLPSALADPAQLESAVLNLALNSQDAMPSGGRLTITTAAASLDGQYQSRNPEVPPGDYVLICITDDGEGMDPTVLEKVFEPFFTTKEVGKGSGLGLSMVYGFVKQSNGHVTIYSAPGLGTTVRMYLPEHQTQSPKSRKRFQREDESVPLGSQTVLVVEDDPFVRAYAVMCLESLGYTVVSAANGKDALQRLGEELQIDVLFTDVVMPGGINGWELADLARIAKPGLPVILASGYALETLVRQGKILSDSVVLTKPYRKAELARRLRDVLAPLPTVLANQQS